MFKECIALLLVATQVSVILTCSINLDRTQHFMHLLHSAAPYYQKSTVVQQMYPYAIAQLGNAFYDCSQTSNVQTAFQVFNQVNQYVIANPIQEYQTVWSQCTDTPITTIVRPSMPRMLSLVFQQQQTVPVTSVNYWQTFMSAHQAIAPQQCLNLGSTLMSSLMACHHTGCYDHVHVHHHHQIVPVIEMPTLPALHSVMHYGYHHHAIVDHMDDHYDDGFLGQVLSQLSQGVSDYDGHGYDNDADHLYHHLLEAVSGHQHSLDLGHIMFH